MAAAADAATVASEGEGLVAIPDTIKVHMKLLTSILSGKTPKTTTNIEKSLATEMATLAKLIVDIAADPSKVNATSAAIIGVDTRAILSYKADLIGTKRNSRAIAKINEGPEFSLKDVPTFGKIPDLWLWPVLERMARPNKIDPRAQGLLAESSAVPLRNAMARITGLPLSFEMCTELMNKDTLHEGSHLNKD